MIFCQICVREKVYLCLYSALIILFCCFLSSVMSRYLFSFSVNPENICTALSVVIMFCDFPILSDCIECDNVTSDGYYPRRGLKGS